MKYFLRRNSFKLVPSVCLCYSLELFSKNNKTNILCWIRCWDWKYAEYYVVLNTWLLIFWAPFVSDQKIVRIIIKHTLFTPTLFLSKPQVASFSFFQDSRILKILPFLLLLFIALFLLCLKEYFGLASNISKHLKRVPNNYFLLYISRLIWINNVCTIIRHYVTFD